MRRPGTLVVRDLRSLGVTRRGDLAVTCWCEDALVSVTPDEVFKGITKSCGLTKCKP